MRGEGIVSKRGDYQAAFMRLAATTYGLWIPGKIPGTVVSEVRAPDVTDEIFEKYGGTPVASDMSEADRSFLIHAKRDLIRYAAEIKRLRDFLTFVGIRDPETEDDFDDAFERWYNVYLQKQYAPDDKDLEIIELKREVKRLQNLIGCFDDGLEEDVMAAVRGLERTLQLKFERAKEATNCERPAWTGHAKR